MIGSGTKPGNGENEKSPAKTRSYFRYHFYRLSVPTDKSRSDYAVEDESRRGLRRIRVRVLLTATQGGGLSSLDHVAVNRDTLNIATGGDIEHYIQH